jgi:hypothetical protein
MTIQNILKSNIFFFWQKVGSQEVTLIFTPINSMWSGCLLNCYNNLSLTYVSNPLAFFFPLTFATWAIHDTFLFAYELLIKLIFILDERRMSTRIIHHVIHPIWSKRRQLLCPPMGMIVSIWHNPLINIKEDTTRIIHSIHIYKHCAFCSHEFGQPPRIHIPT